MLKRLKKLLIDQAGKERQNLTILLTGASIFFMGIGLIYYAEHAFNSSLKQEFCALAGLLFATIGGILAAIGYLSLSILRIFKFINDDDKK
ncbi:MAG: hypothetical protein V7739_05940 [Motiliproteus sp.]